MKKHLLCILLLVNGMLFSQKEIKHTLTMSDNLKAVYFKLNSVFEITLHTTTNQEITIVAHSEGEYANYFTINETKTETVLNVEGDVSFVFPDFQDKLSAHKVHSISVEIWVPENLQIILQSDIGNITASGVYASLLTDSASGNCFLKALKGKVKASSISGAIYLETSEGLVTTKTNLGTVYIEQMPRGVSTFDLKTNKGDIIVTKL